jgi:hypothetical protein
MNQALYAHMNNKRKMKKKKKKLALNLGTLVNIPAFICPFFREVSRKGS